MADAQGRGNTAYAGYSGKWQDRFAFFDVFGAPGTAYYKEGMRALKPMSRVKYGMNVWALFFGPLFFLAKGMWRKAATLLLILAVVVTAVPYVPMLLAQAALTVLALLSAMVANWAFYRVRTRGDRSWNPWAGIGRA